MGMTSFVCNQAWVKWILSIHFVPTFETKHHLEASNSGWWPFTGKWIQMRTNNSYFWFSVSFLIAPGVKTGRAFGPIALKTLQGPTKCYDQGPKWSFKMLAHSNTWCIKDIRTNNLALTKIKGPQFFNIRGPLVALDIFALFRPLDSTMDFEKIAFHFDYSSSLKLYRQPVRHWNWLLFVRMCRGLHTPSSFDVSCSEIHCSKTINLAFQVPVKIRLDFYRTCGLSWRRSCFFPPLFFFFFFVCRLNLPFDVILHLLFIIQTYNLTIHASSHGNEGRSLSRMWW